MREGGQFGRGSLPGAEYAARESSRVKAVAATITRGAVEGGVVDRVRREGGGPLRLARLSARAQALEPAGRGQLQLAALRVPLPRLAEPWQALRQIINCYILEVWCSRMRALPCGCLSWNAACR